MSILLISHPLTCITCCSPDVHVLKTDYSLTNLTSLLKSSRIDAVVSNLNGPTSGAPQSVLIDAAKDAGVKRFLPSEFGVDTTNPKVLELVEFAKWKKQNVDYLKTKEGDGFEWTSLITGPFFDWVGYPFFCPSSRLTTQYRDFNAPSLPLTSRNTNSINGTMALFPLPLPTLPLSGKR